MALKCPACGSVNTETGDTVRTAGHCRACAVWRDKFAANALQGILAGPLAEDGADPELCADHAYAFADAMMRRRGRA